MKQTISSVFLILCALSLFAQKPKPQPFIIQGHLINYPEKKLTIYSTSYRIHTDDTVTVDYNGNFYLRTFKIKRPQFVSIGYYKTTISGIAAAPGYNLTVTADCSDYKSVVNTVKIQGRGAGPNKYGIVFNKAIREEKGIHDWSDMNGPDLVAFVKHDKKLRDSIVHAVFNKKLVTDKYLADFKQMAILSNSYYDQYYLLEHIDINIITKKYDYAKAVSFANAHLSRNLLYDINHGKHLSNDYNGLANAYLRYVLDIDYLKDSTLRKDKFYPLKKAVKLFSGNARQVVLYNLVTSSQLVPSIGYAHSFTELNTIIHQYKLYIAMLSESLRKDIDLKLSQRYTELARTAIGQPAPAFTLSSNTETMHSLSDFKGKVVFIDLWASWCHSCREESPYLNVLYNKLKADDRIIFISIAVGDIKKDWLKAIETDKPGWLQLIDKDSFIQNAYVEQGIPKFILIDKKGDIAMLDTPLPSSGKKLEDVLLAEMAK